MTFDDNSFGSGKNQFPQYKSKDQIIRILVSSETKAVYDKKKNRLEFNPSPHLSKFQIPKSYLVDPEISKKSIGTKLKKSQFLFETMEAVFTPGTKKDSNGTKYQVNFDYHHQFLYATSIAWSEHYPIILTPIQFWILILQGVAVHVNLHSEKLRKQWVNHEGKLPLLVEADDFVLGSDKNNWTRVVSDFNSQIMKKTVKDTYTILDGSQFSSKTPNELVSVGVTIMDICQKYFSYGMSTCCGFPKVILEGNANDWKLLKEKTTKLLSSKVDKKFGQKWLKSLNPILDRFIEVYDKDHIVDCVFWNSMIKRGATSGSGGFSYTSGWINAFLPYQSSKSENGFCFKDEAIYTKKNVPYYASEGLSHTGSSGWVGLPTGFDEDDIPTGLSSAPVQWMYLGTKYHLEFISGFMGYKQDKNDDYSIKPVCGWSIIHTMDEKKKQQLNSESHMFGW